MYNNRLCPPQDYDGVLKDIFQIDRPTVWNRLTGGAAIVEVLIADFQEVRQRRADLVVRLDDESILNLEFQTVNDAQMPFRMGTYALMIGERYQRPVRQCVLYVGTSAHADERWIGSGSRSGEV
jgi:hypothetical protein